MTISQWVVIGRWIISLEALLGIALNIALMALLIRADIGKEARLYRISCMITAFLGFYTSFLLLLLEDLVMLVDRCLAVVLYGPLLFHLPNFLIDILAVSFFTHVHTMWQTISAPSIVQWMHLARPNSSAAQRLACAYSIPIMFYLNTLYYMRALVPDESLKAELVSSIYALHGTDLNDFHIYGFRMKNETVIDLQDVMLFEAIPSYLASYSLFTFSALQIRSHLRRYGNIGSRRTAQMQRRFFRIQIAQVLLPLALLSPPMCIALVAGLNGANFANLSFLLDFTLWLSPSATAFLLLIFVTKSSRNRTAKTSTSKIVPSPRATSMSAKFF